MPPPGKPSVPRPLIPVACALACGIVFDRFVPLPVWILLSLCGALGAAAGACMLPALRRSAAASVLVYLLVAASGALSHHVRYHHVPDGDVSHVAREEPLLVSLRGKVVTEPWHQKLGRRDDYLASYDVAVDGVRAGGAWADASGRVRVRQYGALKEIPFGARVELTGSIRVPPAPTGPGQVDYREYLRRSRIRAILTVPGAHHARVTRRTMLHPVRTLAHHIRWRARGVIERSFPPKEGAVLDAMILGNRRAVTEESLWAFAASGTMHFLAISGLHVGIIAGLIWWILKHIGVPAGWTRGTVMAVVILYAYVTGGRPPIVRAAVMTCAFCFATFMDREADIMNVLATAALVLLACAPANLFDAGFQLSFAAVFAIAGLMPLITPFATRVAAMAEGWFAVRR